MRRLGTRFPPDHLTLDRVEFGESPLDTRLGFQGGIHFITRHPIGQQCPLQRALRRLAQATLAREFVQVEEILQRCGLLTFERVDVVSDRRRPNDVGHRAVGDGAGDEVHVNRGAARPRFQVLARVDTFEQPRIARPNGIR
ncbi:hypothetical protein D3C76_1391860 [compost metagenome]